MRPKHVHWPVPESTKAAHNLVGVRLGNLPAMPLAAGACLAAWLLLGGPRIESAAVLLLGGGAGLGVAVWAFSRPGLAQDGQAHSARVHDGSSSFLP